MSVRRDTRFGTWFYRKWVRTPDGRKVRIFGTPKAEGLPETRAGAEQAERRAITRVLETGEPKKLVTNKEVPTVREFHTVFLDASRIKNKPSSVCLLPLERARPYAGVVEPRGPTHTRDQPSPRPPSRNPA